MKQLRIILLIPFFINAFYHGSVGQEKPSAVQTSNCEANFTYAENPTEPYTYEFIDLSTGLINDWIWSVDDNTFSIEQNPVFSFPGQGSYKVCLTISNFDSLNFCYDEYCTVIIIIDSIECVADFEYVLDSNSNAINKFKFFDKSLGNPDYWFWDFGDGFTSTEQNPVHTFQQEGQYNVCLTVANGNFINCVDTICKQVKMPEYFSFGGFAFAGEQPINNPVHSGDTGLALLYKKYSNDKIILLDTNIFFEYGYYHFSYKLPGEYLIKIMLLPKSAHFKNFMTSYYPDQHFWDQAHSVLIGDSNAYNMHVHLKEIPGAEQGPGSISGKVIEEQLSPFERPYPTMLTEVILADPDGLPLAFTFCDQDGNFIFRNLAYGHYKLFADHTGKYALPVLVQIDEVQPLIDTINITLSDHSPAAIENFEPAAILEVGNVYPNPVNENVHLKISLRKQAQLEINIMNLVGQRILHQEFDLAAGKQRVNITTGGIPNGLYHLQILTSSGESISRKLIKY